MSVLAHGLEALPFLLHWVFVVAQAVDFETRSLNLRGLACSRTLNQCADDADACAGGDVLERLFVELRGVDYHLNVLNGRAVVQCDEVDCFRAAVRAHPALHADVLSVFCALQHVDYPCSFHLTFAFDI